MGLVVVMAVAAMVFWVFFFFLLKKNAGYLVWFLERWKIISKWDGYGTLWPMWSYMNSRLTKIIKVEFLG